MSVYQFEVLNKITDRKKPFINKGVFIIPTIKHKYKYFIEAARYNTNIQDKEYFYLFSNNKFDNNCRRCRVDDYGRLKLKPAGEIKDILYYITKNNGNVELKYVESTDQYDVWQIIV